ncbi:MAG: tetratricopeptide repeat protein [Pirellulaceae bacterium]
MSSSPPVLRRFYAQYLTDEHSAGFVKRVSERYTIATLERLAEQGSRESRRAATMSLGFLADFASNTVLGRRLHDSDRGVRLLAENGLRDIWCRDGSDSQQLWMRKLLRLNVSRQSSSAIEQASLLIDEAPWFAEAWNQRAIAYYRIGRYADSAGDCHQTLELNPYHFAATVGMANCYLQLNDGHAALECFRRALKLNPSLERVRTQAARLQRVLKRK